MYEYAIPHRSMYRRFVDWFCCHVMFLAIHRKYHYGAWLYVHFLPFVMIRFGADRERFEFSVELKSRYRNRAHKPLAAAPASDAEQGEGTA